MKSQWFGCRKRYDFARAIHDSHYGMDNYEKFRAFLTMVECELRQAVWKMNTGEFNNDFSERYKREWNRLEHPEKMIEAFCLLVQALEEKRYDFIGTTLGELGLADSKWKGQCFTPPELCTLMANMTMSDKEPDDNHTLLLDECAVGGGAILIAASDTLIKKNFWPWHYHWFATDVDQKCFQMAYIQCSLLGIPATIINGNSLTLEEFDRATTITGILHPPRQWRKGWKPKTDSFDPVEYEQPNLF